MSSTEITIVRSRIEKAAISGEMSTAEQVTFFADIDKLLTSHAHRKHPTLSAAGAFAKEYEKDAAFRSVPRKAQSLQAEMNYS